MKVGNGMTVFLDTMIWLHYQQVDDIDWNLILPGRPPPVIVVPRVTTRELDKHKNSHRSNNVKARARRWLTNLVELQAGKSPTLKNGVTLELFLSQPKIDFGGHGLDPASNDDVLLATILEYQRLNPGVTVRLFSADATPRLVATQFGIDAVEFPEALKLDEEPDPIAKELRDLKAEVEKSKNARPILSGGFLINDVISSLLTLDFEQPTPFPEAQVEAMLEEFHRNYPPLHARSSGLPQFTQLQEILGPSEEEYARYNREVREYPNDVRQYARACYAIMMMTELGTAIRIQISNRGTIPADDVDVELTFPKKCLIVEEIPETPDAPAEPTKPRPRMDIPMVPRALERFDPSHFVVRPPEEPFTIEKIPAGFRVKQHFKRIKHGHSAQMDQFHLSFHDLASADSFSVRCRITAANQREPVELKLNVRVSKPLSSTIT